MTAPTLVLHGTADPEVPERELFDLLKALSDAELVRLTGEGHLLPLTCPDIVSNEISRWERQVRAADNISCRGLLVDGTRAD